FHVTGVQTCALPIFGGEERGPVHHVVGGAALRVEPDRTGHEPAGRGHAGGQAGKGRERHGHRDSSPQDGPLQGRVRRYRAAAERAAPSRLSRLASAVTVVAALWIGRINRSDPSTTARPVSWSST